MSADWTPFETLLTPVETGVKQQGHLESHLCIIVGYHAKQTQLIIYNYNNNEIQTCLGVFSWFVQTKEKKEQTSWSLKKILF